MVTLDLLRDPDSRVHAAMADSPMALGTWASVQLAAAIYNLMGGELAIPGSDLEEHVQRVAPAELEAARARLLAHSAIADLPEE